MNAFSSYRNSILGLAFGWAAAAAQDGNLNHVGLGLKVGESAGLVGMQLSANLSRDLQINAGWGLTVSSVSIMGSAIEESSRFAAARYYHGGWYASTGYTRKTVSVSATLDGKVYSDTRAEHGIPVHLGYEFGGRTGFYSSLSFGYLNILGGGGETILVGTDQDNTGTKSAASGVSIGLGLGYYLF